MPPNANKVTKRLNFYGFLGLFVLILSISGYFILLNASCNSVTSQHYDKLEPIQIVGSVTGLLLFVLSFYNIAIVLYLFKTIFYVVITAILSMGCLMFWGAYIAFTEPCNTGLLGLSTQNAFQAEDGSSIAVTILDIFAGLLLFSTGATFANRL